MPKWRDLGDSIMTCCSGCVTVHLEKTQICAVLRLHSGFPGNFFTAEFLSYFTRQHKEVIR